MPPVEEPAYPPCETRTFGKIKGVIKHALCTDNTKDQYRRLVRPVDCERCLAGLPPVAEVQPDQGAAPEPPLPETPGLARRVLSYAEAVARWTAAGRPERSDKEVERIFHQHCKPCKWFERDRQRCRGCGCRVADSGLAISNKIKMATENCPRELW